MPDNHEQQIRVAKFVLLCGNLVWLISGTFLAATALFLALQEQLPLKARLSWFGVIIVITLARALLLRKWNSTPTTVDNVDQRILLATCMTAIMAISFSTLGFFAVSENNPLISLLVVMVMTGMVASATASISHIVPMYVFFILPLMLPVALRFFTFSEPGYHWIASLILLYLAICLGTSRSIRSSIMHSINVRFENLELLENLQHEKQRAEEALKHAESANHAKSKFLAAASHDLRQPLHSLRLFTATLELQTRETRHKTLVSKIDSSVKSLEDLFNALLDISKLDAGTFTVSKQHVHLDGLLSQIEGEFKLVAQVKELRFNVVLEDFVVYTDALLLERLIRNLASNAVRYTNAGEVTISTQADNEKVWVSITDTGIGIPKADQTRVFEEFVQLGNVERDRNQGIGLGLSIVKRLSDLLEVDMKVESALGHGSTFTIGVPLGDPEQCLYASAFLNPSTDSVDSLFVLVIDDEEEVCLAIEGLLETWGCIVMTAISGDAAIEQLQEIGEIPDILVSDYRLRDGENGGEVIQRIRDHFKQSIPAIILTGDIAPDRLIDIKALGYPMLHKPCEPDALRHLLATESAASDVNKPADEPVCDLQTSSAPGA